MAKVKKNGVPFASKLTGIRNIEKRNEVFNSLTPEEKRKEIAYDALYLAVTRQLGASENSDYWNSKLYSEAFRLNTAKELQTLLVKNLPESCEVCQRGLMMVSQIRLGNTIEPKDDDIMCGSVENLNGFSMASFDQMERAYEGWETREEYTQPYEENSQELLANICCNVIANGDFKISDTTDYLTLWGIKIRKKVVKTSIMKVLEQKDKNEKV